MSLRKKVGKMGLRQIMKDIIITKYVERKRKKKQDQNLSFKETLLGIARKRVSLKVEGVDAQQT